MSDMSQVPIFSPQRYKPLTHFIFLQVINKTKHSSRRHNLPLMANWSDTCSVIRGSELSHRVFVCVGWIINLRHDKVGLCMNLWISIPQILVLTGMLSHNLLAWIKYVMYPIMNICRIQVSACFCPWCWSRCPCLHHCLALSMVPKFPSSFTSLCVFVHGAEPAFHLHVTVCLCPWCGSWCPSFRTLPCVSVHGAEAAVQL